MRMLGKKNQVIIQISLVNFKLESTGIFSFLGFSKDKPEEEDKEVEIEVPENKKLIKELTERRVRTNFC